MDKDPWFYACAATASLVAIAFYVALVLPLCQPGETAIYLGTVIKLGGC